jgi:cation:H+ antiporter
LNRLLLFAFPGFCRFGVCGIFVRYRSRLLLSFGLVGLFIGGELIVGNGVKLATGLGVSETVIGLTIVAIGTSLPEITTVVVGTLRGHSEVALGNVLGSNVFNTFAVMGAAGMAGPVMIEPSLYRFDFWVMLLATFVLLAFVLTRKPIGRKTGAAFVLAYVAYMVGVVLFAV